MINLIRMSNEYWIVFIVLFLKISIYLRLIYLNKQGKL